MDAEAIARLRELYRGAHTSADVNDTFVHEVFDAFPALLDALEEAQEDYARVVKKRSAETTEDFEQIDALRAQVAELTRERDEARGKLDMLVETAREMGVGRHLDSLRWFFVQPPVVDLLNPPDPIRVPPEKIQGVYESLEEAAKLSDYRTHLDAALSRLAALEKESEEAHKLLYGFGHSGGDVKPLPDRIRHLVRHRRRLEAEIEAACENTPHEDVTLTQWVAALEKVRAAAMKVPIARVNPEPDGVSPWLTCKGCGSTDGEPCAEGCWVSVLDAALDAALKERDA